jgi:hypothetical protein
VADVLLRFKLQLLDRAEAAAKKVQAEVRKSSDLDKEARKAALAAGRDTLQQIRAAKAQARQESRLRKQAGLGQRSISGGEDLFAKVEDRHLKKAFGRVNLLEAAAKGLKSDQLSDQLSAIGSVVGKIPVVGDIAELVIDVAEVLVKKFEAHAEEVLARATDEAVKRLEERLSQTDLGQLFLDNPEYAIGAANRQFARDQALEAGGNAVPYLDEG